MENLYLAFLKALEKTSTPMDKKAGEDLIKICSDYYDRSKQMRALEPLHIQLRQANRKKGSTYLGNSNILTKYILKRCCKLLDKHARRFYSHDECEDISSRFKKSSFNTFCNDYRDDADDFCEELKIENELLCKRISEAIQNFNRTKKKKERREKYEYRSINWELLDQNMDLFNDNKVKKHYPEQDAFLQILSPQLINWLIKNASNPIILTFTTASFRKYFATCKHVSQNSSLTKGQYFKGSKPDSCILNSDFISHNDKWVDSQEIDARLEQYLSYKNQVKRYRNLRKAFDEIPIPTSKN